MQYPKKMMKPLSILRCTLLVLLTVFIGITVSYADVQFTDTNGDEITLPNAASRIVCLNGDAAEMLIVLGAGDRVVGLTQTAMNDPVLMAHLRNAENVGDWQTPSVERILALHPDAVITYSSSKPKNADQFTAAGISLIYLDCYKINTLEHDAIAMEQLIGEEEAADAYLSWLNKWADLISSKTKDISLDAYPRVYIEGYTDYSAQGTDSGSDMLVTRAKGKNIAQGLQGQWPKVTPEWVMKEDPAVIIKVIAAKPDLTLASAWESLINRAGFKDLTAVTDNNVYIMNGDLTLGPRSPAGLVYVASLLHPDLFSDISPRDALVSYADSFVPGADEGETVYPLI